VTKPRQRAVVILAAGKSTRMKSKTSKVLHTVGGRSLLAWAAGLARSAGAARCIAVIGAKDAALKSAAESLGLETVVQGRQLGTGHAVLSARTALEGFGGDMVVLYADTPLIKPQTLEDIFDSLSGGVDVAVLGFEPKDAGAYGRLIEKDGKLDKIVEAKDAQADELAVTLCNSGVMAASAPDMFAALAAVKTENAGGEYYLTDIVEIINKKGGEARTVRASAEEVLGVNSRTDLALAEQAFQARMRTEMLENGVTLRDPASVYFSWDTQIMADVDVGANVVFGPGVRIEEGATIHPYCHIEGATIGTDSQIGPFARLRPGAQMGAGSRAGNFVEIKKSTIGANSKINHLSYIGDAEIAENVNIGAGTITCNYDGFRKHKTIIGAGAFIGTHSSLIAPLTIGAGAYLATGGVITDDVPKDALALGRAKQTNKQGWARRYRAAQKKRLQKRAGKET